MDTWEWKPGDTMKSVQGRVLEKALIYYKGNQTHTAAALGLSLRTVRIKIIEYNLRALVKELREATPVTMPALFK